MNAVTTIPNKQNKDTEYHFYLGSFDAAKDLHFGNLNKHDRSP